MMVNNQTTRRNFLKRSSLAVGASFIPVFSSAFGNSANHPNVLLILTDDQGYGDLRIHGNEKIDTPVLDHFAKESTRFDRFYVSPICAPTRASLMTGRYFLRTGVIEVVPDDLSTMRTDEVTIAEIFKQADYRTAIFGKWHLGLHYPNHPNNQGFDEFIGFRSGASQYYDVTLDHNGEPYPTKGYLTDLFTDFTIDFIEKNRNKPWFCYLPYNAPHAPFQVPDRYFNKYKQRGLSDKNAAVYGMCESVDANVGRILKKLDDLELANDTIVIFLSDNGPNGHRYNAGMKGNKGKVDEGGVRVPMFIRWPGQLKSNRVIEQISADIDILPTLVDLCNIPRPRTLPLDGISLKPLLMNDNTKWLDRMLFNVRMDGAEGKAPQLAKGAVRTQKWRFTDKGGRIALYDMIADPGQKKDVSKEYPDVTRKLYHAFRRWFYDVTRNGLAKFPIPVGYEIEPVVDLLARHAYLSGNVSVKGKVPWDIDWIHSWKDRDHDFAWWDLQVVHAGDYDVTITYSRLNEKGRMKIAIEAERERLTQKLGGALHGKPLKRKNLRIEEPQENVVKRQITQHLGKIYLPEGRMNLYFRLLTDPDPGFKLNRISLKRL